MTDTEAGGTGDKQDQFRKAKGPVGDQQEGQEEAAEDDV